MRLGSYKTWGLWNNHNDGTSLQVSRPSFLALLLRLDGWIEANLIAALTRLASRPLVISDGRWAQQLGLWAWLLKPGSNISWPAAGLWSNLGVISDIQTLYLSLRLGPMNDWFPSNLAQLFTWSRTKWRVSWWRIGLATSPQLTFFLFSHSVHGVVSACPTSWSMSDNVIIRFQQSSQPRVA